MAYHANDPFVTENFNARHPPCGSPFGMTSGSQATREPPSLELYQCLFLLIHVMTEVVYKHKILVNIKLVGEFCIFDFVCFYIFHINKLYYIFI